MGGDGHGHGGHGGGHGHGDHGHHSHYDNPLKRVWSPSGGYGNEQPLWRQRVPRGIAAFAAVAVISIFTFGRNERTSNFHQPPFTLRYSRYTAEDHPDYPQRLREYHANKPALWKRIFPCDEVDNPPGHHHH